MEVPKYFRNASRDDLKALFEMLWPLMEYESLLDSADYCDIVPISERTCNLCGDICMHVLGRGYAIECQNDECRKLRDYLLISYKVDETSPRNGRHKTDDSKLARESIIAAKKNVLLHDHGDRASFYGVPKELRIEVAYQAVAIMLISKTKKELRNGKVGILGSENIGTKKQRGTNSIVGRNHVCCHQ